MSEPDVNVMQNSSRQIAVMGKRHFCQYLFPAREVGDSVERLWKQRTTLLEQSISPQQLQLADSIASEQLAIDRSLQSTREAIRQTSPMEAGLYAAGVNVAELQRGLQRIDISSRLLQLQMPPHVPLDILPSDPYPKLTSIAPYGAWDNVSSDNRGTLDSLEQAPLTDIGRQFVGSTFKASAMSPSAGEFASIQHARESGLVVNYHMTGAPAKLLIRVQMRLLTGLHSAFFFDTSAGAVYTSIHEYHLPFISMHTSGSSPLFAPVLASGYPGLHGVSWFRSRIARGMATDVRNPTPEENNWNFVPFTLLTTTRDVIDPSSNPDGICIAVGVRHLVQAHCSSSRFSVESIGHWAVDSIDVGPES